jgi:RNA polymerase sigma factor (sigma-70 family)
MTDEIPPPPSGGSAALMTAELVRLARAGSPVAREQLLARYLPRLRRWAAARLPMHARSLFDTSDLVQDTLLKVLQGLQRLELRHPGSFQNYVRHALLNRIRDEVRWAARRKGSHEIPKDLHDRAPSPLENTIGAEMLDLYETSLAQLDDGEREVLYLRIELDYSYEDIATITGRPSPDAARMAFRRALSRLADVMNRPR